MIHPNDVLENVIEKRDYIVTRVGPNDVQCVSRSQGSHYRYPVINEQTLEIVETNVWEVVQCPHIVTPLPLASVSSATSLGNAYNAGAMEFMLERLWSGLNGVGARAEHVSQFALGSEIAELIQMIERCAEMLRPVKFLDGTAGSNTLRDFIYANRK